MVTAFAEGIAGGTIKTILDNNSDGTPNKKRRRGRKKQQQQGQQQQQQGQQQQQQGQPDLGADDLIEAEEEHGKQNNCSCIILCFS